MASYTELVRAIVNENDYLHGIMLDSGIRLESASLQEIGETIILQNPLSRNAFITDLYNKFIMTKVINRLFKNPLEVLKGEKLAPYGDTIENMAVNPAKAIEYDNTQDNILTTVKPDVKVEYIKVNRMDKYRVSIPFAVIKQAFFNEGDFSKFVSACINSLYNGDNIDEYLLMKKVISDTVNADLVLQAQLPTAYDDITLMVKNIFDYMQFPSTQWNSYSQRVPEAPFTTWCPAEELLIIGTANFINSLDVKFLAGAFNLELAKLQKNIVKVDGFEGEKPLQGMVCDKAFLQVHDTLYELAEFSRADDLSTKSYLHHWQTMQASTLANACGLVGEIPSGRVTAMLGNLDSNSILSEEEAKAKAVAAPDESKAEVAEEEAKATTKTTAKSSK